MLRLTLLLAALAISMPVLPSGWAWRDAGGRPLPDTAARKSVKGFGGWLLVTSDNDWERKWNASSGVPQFSEATTASEGDRLFVLIFFSNPHLSREGQAEITCDIDVERPDGSYSVHQTDTVCYNGNLAGPPTNVFLALPVIGFVGQHGDPSGKWMVHVLLRDKLGHVQLSLEANFHFE